MEVTAKPLAVHCTKAVAGYCRGPHNRLDLEGVRAVPEGTKRMLRKSLAQWGVCDVDSRTLWDVLVSNETQALDMGRNGSASADDVLHALGVCSEALRGLRLSSLVTCPVASAWSSVAPMKSLRVMVVSDCRSFSDHVLACVLERAPAVESLALTGRHGVTFKAAALQSAFAAMVPGVSFLDLSDSEGISGEAVEAMLLERARRIDARQCAGERLKSVKLDRCKTWVVDAVARAVDACGGGMLRTLSLKLCWNLSEHALLALSHSNTRLHVLDLSYCDGVTDDVVASFAERCARTLTSIHVDGCISLTDRMLESIGEHSRAVAQLSMTRCHSLTSVAVSHVVRATSHSLTALDLSAMSHVSVRDLDEMIRHVHSRLRSFRLSESMCVLSPYTLRLLGSAPHLHTLAIRNCWSLTDHVMMALVAEMQAGGTAHARRDDQHTGMCSRKELFAAKGGVLPTKQSQHRATLTSLDVSGCNQLSTASMSPLLVLLAATLRRLDVSGCTRVDSAIIRTLVRDRCSRGGDAPAKTHDVSTDGTACTSSCNKIKPDANRNDAGDTTTSSSGTCDPFYVFERLEEVRIGFCRSFRCRALGLLGQRLPALHTLDALDSKFRGVDMAAALKHAAHLRVLRLSGKWITAEVVSAIFQHLPALHELHIENTRHMSSSTVQCIAPFPQPLEVLCVKECPGFDDDALEWTLDRFPHSLLSLSLFRLSAITERVLSLVQTQSQLRVFESYDNPALTSSALNSLRKRSPALEIHCSMIL